MLILTLVCVAWLEIIGIQSARKEARRREAVERLAGMMDAFICDSVMSQYKNKFFKINKKTNLKDYTCAYYSLKKNPLSIESVNSTEIIPMFETEISPIGYRMRILKTSDLNDASKFGNNWTSMSGVSPCYWLIGELFDHNGIKEDDWNPFFTLPVCLGF